MAPSSPSSAAAPTRTSTRKRAASASASAKATDEPSTKRTRRPKAETKPRKKKDEVKEEEKPPMEDDACGEEPDAEEMALGEEAEAEEAEAEQKQLDAPAPGVARKRVAQPSRVRHGSDGDHDPEFVGDPFPAKEARDKWPQRYQRNAATRRPDEEEDIKARCHYSSAKVDGTLYCLHDDVYVKAEEDKADYIGRITEFFEGTDHCHYFTCRWFFRAEDTVISSIMMENADDEKHDLKRVFLSEEKNDNVLDCIISKVKIVYIDPNMESEAKARRLADCDLYYDMSYTVAYSTFANIPLGKVVSDSEASSVGKATLLDLYSGCGGMSTGLCLGAALAGLNLETRWAVDFNSFACESLKYNHPRTEVRNEKADEFLALLKGWHSLCDEYVKKDIDFSSAGASENEEDDDEPLEKDEFVVEKLAGICYGGSGREDGLYFKVQWKGYGREEDTWEPIENLRDCPLKIKEFVQEGYRRKILPLPGDVDVICGGPPCQGISGFNRFRNRKEPLKDEKNKQMVTFMDIVAYLKPKYVLMENVVDILKFADGYLGRYALSRLVAMKYQARLGMMVAGCYGLPQFRMRVFLWGALPTMVLPKYPLPTHNVVVRGGAPNAFSVNNHQPNEVMEYGSSPKTEFQRYIRLSRKEMLDSSFEGKDGPDLGKLLDHQPLKLNKDDHERVQQIPVKKGANFRDLKGVRVGANNIVEWDPDVPRVYLSSGKPLAP
uniref:DNA (cytosine-5-)-methyltransferase n=1 Tax=Oryza sativa subsp. japonica TaxID=39947 RepID=Q8SBB4_ORYSJ|nr:Putative DNA cytosine methyltransferase MET2a [Oryza sativa Japonica Group]